MDLVKDEKEFQKLFWIFAHPFTIAIDIITLPLQALMYALGLILYMMLK